MSTRRAVRASRATRTTRRTVEQQQQQLQQLHLQLDFSSGDAYGVLLPGGDTSGGGGPTLPSSSALGGGVPGGFGFGGASSSGAYNSHRHLSHGKPARKWIRVQRPPAAGVGFRVDVWVPADQLTDVERATYLPPSAKPSEDVFADAAAVAAAPSLPVGVEAAKRSDGGGGDDAADATAQSLTAVSEPGSGATNSERLQGHDQANVLSVRPANEDVEMETAPPREIAAAAETDPTSPDDRPAKRARFAHEDDGTQGQGDAQAGSEMESRRPDVASSTNPMEGAGVETSSASRASADEAPTVPPQVGDTSADGSAEEASVASAVPPSQSAPASEDVANRPSADSDHSRKRDLAECTSATDRQASNDAEEHVECDGPPLKRARASVDDDNDDAVDAATGSANDAPALGVMAAPAESADLPAAGSGATSNAAARDEGSAPATGVDDELPVRGHGHSSQGGRGESADEPSFEPKDDVPL